MTTIADIFPTYEDALRACDGGYNDSEIADVIAFKTAQPVDSRQLLPEQAVNSVLAVGFAAAECPNRPLNVLDFGGGCGVHYFRVAAAMSIALRWAIVETPTMAERAAKLSQGRFGTFTEIEAAGRHLGKIDLVHASGAIPYVPDPIATLKELAELRPRFILLARFPCWGGRTMVSVQTSFLAENGIGPMPPHIKDRRIKFPVTFTYLDDVIRALSGYDIVVAMDSPSGSYDFRGQTIPGRSFLFRSNEPAR
jgi:putative methyltransferase (TIGR04325 family)